MMISQIDHANLFLQTGNAPGSMCAQILLYVFNSTCHSNCYAANTICNEHFYIKLGK